MEKSKIDKRTRLLDAANKLVQQQGFNQTTLADIAQESSVPLGNVYYYYKTKDDIGLALIEHRTECIRSQLREWGCKPKPPKFPSNSIQVFTRSCFIQDSARILG